VGCLEGVLGLWAARISCIVRAGDLLVGEVESGICCVEICSDEYFGRLALAKIDVWCYHSLG
jgi:hypothetical protein